MKQYTIVGDTQPALLHDEIEAAIPALQGKITILGTVDRRAQISSGRVEKALETLVYLQGPDDMDNDAIAKVVADHVSTAPSKAEAKQGYRASGIKKLQDVAGLTDEEISAILS